MIKTKALEAYLEGKLKALTQELLKLDSEETLKDYLDWTINKLKYNEATLKEVTLKQQISSLKLPEDKEAIDKLKLERKSFLQKDKPYELNVGDIINVKFGYGIGHELTGNHYAIILDRKGAMFLVAPLTSTPQNFGDNTAFFDNLSLPRNKDKVSADKPYRCFVAFSQIRYVHCRRINSINSLPNLKKWPAKITLTSPQVTDVLTKYINIISGK